MKNISILIAEDEKLLLDRLVNYLGIFCETVYKASNGEEAFCLYEKYHPDIILTDIDMPKLTGVELVQKIREKKSNTQLIILSAHTNTEDFLKVIPLSLVSYLVKPIKMEQLKQIVLQAIENLAKEEYITLNNGYVWNKEKKHLLLNNQKIELTTNENAFIDILVAKLNHEVSYEDIHNHIYNVDEYSQDALFTLAKRVRKKTTKDFIKSSFKYGYILESQ